MRSRVISLRTGARVAPGATGGSRRRFATPRARKQSNGQPSPERLTQLAWGFAPPLILDAALNFRVFDLLDPSPNTVAELAARSGASTRGLTAVLNALVGLGLLARRENRYALTPESATFLVSTKPAYLGGFYRHLTRQVLPNWMQLKESVRTGQPVSRWPCQGLQPHFVSCSSLRTSAVFCVSTSMRLASQPSAIRPLRTMNRKRGMAHFPWRVGQAGLCQRPGRVA